MGRVLGVWAVLTAVAVGLLWGLAGPVLLAPRPQTFADLLTAAAAVVLAGCLAWLWSVCTAVLVGALLGVDLRRAGAWAGPPAVRRAVVAACGLALAGTTAPALAAPATVGGPLDGPVDGPGAAGLEQVAVAVVAPGGTGVRVLAGLPLPERAVAPARRPVVAVLPRSVLVRPGDSLWSLAAAALPPRAAERLVDAGWRALYRANATAIGPDPDLIHPGLRLRVPAVPDHEETP